MVHCYYSIYSCQAEVRIFHCDAKDGGEWRISGEIRFLLVGHLTCMFSSPRILRAQKTETRACSRFPTSQVLFPMQINRLNA